MWRTDLNGIINIYKEKGYTSHDVVAKLRGILKLRRIGHTGTLDPDAEGVLPICVGKATSLCEYLTEKEKEYEADIHLGIITDTLDLSGEILESNECNCSYDEIVDAVNSFQGEIMQIPPMYSAIKVNGKRLYSLARNGQEIERKPRKVNIKSIEIIEYIEDSKIVRIRATVSKGTYIRSLCDDIGRKLGCGACMGKLVRTKSGVYVIEEAIKLVDVENAVRNDVIAKSIATIESVFGMPAVRTLAEFDKRVKNGNYLEENMVQSKTVQKDDAYIITGDDDVCVYLSDNSFAAVYRFDREREVYKPLKMFI
ncbi:MAG: tRNA pseudouridine(55) synthase TruB [Lachnospiraceae bacterium]|nr:tRNA pseudouridine(55) synthase TruB [Lachnospiraceae bacterium]